MIPSGSKSLQGFFKLPHTRTDVAEHAAPIRQLDRHRAWLRIANCNVSQGHMIASLFGVRTPNHTPTGWWLNANAGERLRLDNR